MIGTVRFPRCPSRSNGQLVPRFPKASLVGGFDHLFNDIGEYLITRGKSDASLHLNFKCGIIAGSVVGSHDDIIERMIVSSLERH